MYLLKSDEYKVFITTPKNNMRYQHTMICENNYIYAIGGVNSNLVERYDIEKDFWENLPQMNYKRIYLILYIYNDYLYCYYGKK